MTPSNRIPLKYAQGLKLAKECRYGNRIVAHNGERITELMLKSLPKDACEQLVLVREKEDLQEQIDLNVELENNKNPAQLSPDVRTFPADFILFLEGDESKEIYVLLEGELEVLKGEEVVAEIATKGSFLGEMAVLRSQPRFTEVRTKTPSKLLVFDGNQLLSAAETKPEILSRMCTSLARKLSIADKTYTKRMGDAVTSGLFSDFFDGFIQNVDEEQPTYKRGELILNEEEVLFKQNERSTEIFILIKGEVGVYINDTEVARIRRKGQVIGEMSGLLCKPRAATIRALAHTKLLCIPSAQLADFTKEHPVLMHQMCVGLAERIADTTDDFISLAKLE